MRLMLVLLLWTFVSSDIYSRGYRGRSNHTPKKGIISRASSHSSSHSSSPKKGMSRHAYKQLRSRITYLKTLQASRELSIDPITGDRVYSYPEAILSFPGRHQVTQAKFKRSAFFQKYKLDGNSYSDLDRLANNLEPPPKETPVTADNSCEKAIETRKIVQKKKDRKSEALYQKYKRMCEEK